MAVQYHKAQDRDEGKRTVLVTGATGAIGRAIAQQLAEQDYAVVLAARNEQKARLAVGQIKCATDNEHVYFELVDLSRKSAIQALADRWPGKLDVLVNNAGTTPRRRLETLEGIEMQWATNVLGYFWMMQAFAEKLKEAAPARVINVASYWAGGLDLSDPEFKQRRYDNGSAYRQSKQADRMLSAAFAERFAPGRVTVNACHPGDVNSQLSNDLGFGGSESPDAGARTPVWLATDPTGGRETGKYFEHMHESQDRFTSDRSAVEALYEICLSY